VSLAYYIQILMLHYGDRMTRSRCKLWRAEIDQQLAGIHMSEGKLSRPKLGDGTTVSIQ
jgi:hypothetical protein